MRNTISLTGSSVDLSTNHRRDPALAGLYRQILRTAQTHPSAHVRASMQWAYDGNKGPCPQPEPNVPVEATPEPGRVAKVPEPRRAPLARPTFGQQSALGR